MNTQLIQTFRRKLTRGPVFGPFSKTSDAGIIETIGMAGFDFVILDREHGPNTLETTQQLIRAAELHQVFPVVRVPDTSETAIGQALDIGAGGIQVPQINNPEQVAAVVRAARFAPAGRRGVCRFVRAARYAALPKADYFKQANTALIVIQLEGREALDNLEPILDVPGFDLIFIGPYDLSQSVGHPGEVRHPEVVACMRRIVRTCLNRHIPVGTFTDTPEDAAFWKRQGVRYLSYSVDMGIITDAMRKQADILRTGSRRPQRR